MDCSLLGSSVHGIFQARILEWVAISFSKPIQQRCKVVVCPHFIDQRKLRDQVTCPIAKFWLKFLLYSWNSNPDLVALRPILPALSLAHNHQQPLHNALLTHLFPRLACEDFKGKAVHLKFWRASM